MPIKGPLRLSLDKNFIEVAMQRNVLNERNKKAVSAEK